MEVAMPGFASENSAKRKRTVRRTRRGGTSNPVLRVPGRPDRPSRLRWSSYLERWIVPVAGMPTDQDPALPTRMGCLGGASLEKIEAHPLFLLIQFISILISIRTGVNRQADEWMGPRVWRSVIMRHTQRVTRWVPHRRASCTHDRRLGRRERGLDPTEGRERSSLPHPVH